jgi:hypothetical protein
MANTGQTSAGRCGEPGDGSANGEPAQTPYRAITIDWVERVSSCHARMIDGAIFRFGYALQPTK